MPDSVIGMYGVTRPDKFWISMQPTGGPSCGTLTFRAPYGGGNYDFRLFENNVYRKHMGASNVVRLCRGQDPALTHTFVMLTFILARLFSSMQGFDSTLSNGQELESLKA